jgi:hypothetical protein
MSRLQRTPLFELTESKIKPRFSYKLGLAIILGILFILKLLTL